MDETFRAIAAESKLPEQIARQLADVGYIVIDGPVAHNKCEELAKAYDAAVLAAHPDDVRISSSTRINDFVNRGAAFDELYIYGPLLAACCQIIARPFRLSTMHARTIEPGTSVESLHVDFERQDDGWPMVGFIIMVDEFRSDNGATRFVPGSHLSTNNPGEDGAVMACGPAGSIIIYNGSVWHGWTANRSASTRRSIQGAFIRRDCGSGVDLRARMRPETLDRIGRLAKYLLEVEQPTMSQAGDSVVISDKR